MRKTMLFALSLIGWFDCAYLFWVYTSRSRPLLCLGTGCDVVRASAYASVHGIPTPAFGLAMYVALALLIFATPLAPARHEGWIQYAVAVISGAGFGISLYLTGIEAFVLHAWCVWCVVSAIVVTLMFALALWELLRPQPAADPAAALAGARQRGFVLLVAIAVGVPSFVYLTRRGEAVAAESAAAPVVAERLVRPDSHVYGNPRAPVTVVEFGDFQCPICGRTERAAEEVRTRYGDRVRFIFRQYPMPNLHANAEKAAEASECAAEQGKFWEAVARLYATQEDLGVPALEGDAAAIGLDTERFKQCLSSGRMAARVLRDKEDGKALGVQGTPTFFVGQRMIAGPIDLAEFSSLLDAELASHAPAPAGGASPPSSVSPGGQQPFSPSGVLGQNAGDVFAQFQAPGTTCNENEAQGQQPNLIRTAEAHMLFQANPKPVFVDVRDAKDFKTGRIPGALDMPIDRFQSLWGRLPKDRTLILYESGRSAGDVCASSRAAGRILLQHGFSLERVKVYQDGLAGWQKAGLPVEH